MIYVQGLSEQITKAISNKLDCKIAFKNKKTLNNLIYSKLKSNIPQSNRSNLIYSVNCKDCTTNYIGQTGQYLSNRLSKHRSDINLGNNGCALAQHALSQNHSFDFEQCKIMDVEPNLAKRKLKEMIHIVRTPITCNLRTDTANLSQLYTNLIKSTCPPVIQN